MGNEEQIEPKEEPLEKPVKLNFKTDKWTFVALCLLSILLMFWANHKGKIDGAREVCLNMDSWLNEDFKCDVDPILEEYNITTIGWLNSPPVIESVVKRGC